MLSQSVEYALRAVCYLAERSPDPQTTEQIARGTKSPAPYLSKVLQQLVRGGVVRSQRGVNGGMALARPAKELTLLEVVNAVDPIQRIHTCPLELEAHGANLCPLHRRLDDALATVEHAFRNTTLAEVLAEPNPSAPLCGFPHVAAVQKQ